jgi:hypothetical protein
MLNPGYQKENITLERKVFNAPLFFWGYLDQKWVWRRTYG